MKKQVAAFFILLQVLSLNTYAANACVDLFSNYDTHRSVEKVRLTDVRYTDLLNNLRSTLTGKLATVWRSEWKTKLSVYRSNQYVFNLLNQNLSPETFKVVLKNLDVRDEGFVRKVHQRMSDLQRQGLTNTDDKIAVRDAPPPSGANDSTFTYYTKPLVDQDGNAKHQPRIRTYLREVEFNKMSVDEPAQGTLADGSKVTLIRKEANLFDVNINDSSKLLTLAEVTHKFGKNFRMFAPHGKSYKLEIKSALDDIIISPYYKKLNGNHNVQKLDVTLTQAQVTELFAPLSAKDPASQILESKQRIEKLEQVLIAKDPANEARIKAVLAVLNEGVNGNSEFLIIEGATAYHRSAFESTAGFQTTVDRNQGVYVGDMYQAGELKNPIKVTKLNDRLVTGDSDARHVELKLPINLVVDVLGVKFSDPRSSQLVQHQAFPFQTIDNVVKLYNSYVTNKDHPGKFNYLRESAAEIVSDHD